MNNDLARSLERLRQVRTAIRYEQVKVALTRIGAARLGAGELAPGDRVFDPVTGQEGVIEHVARANVIVPVTKG